MDWVHERAISGTRYYQFGTVGGSGRAHGEVELPTYRKFADSRLRALATAVHAEMVAGFPGGRLFLDSVEQAMAVALVNGHAVKHRPVQTYRGGLGAARLRRIKELVHAQMEGDLSLDDMAESVGLSTAHFARMFRKSTGETPHQFVLRPKIERAKTMLLAPDARVLDVAVACGFRTQQHLAQVFRDLCGVSPTAYRQDFLRSEAACASEISSESTPHLVIIGSKARRRLQELPFTSPERQVLSALGARDFIRNTEADI